MRKVLVTARSFGKISDTPFQILKDAGFEVVTHPRRGPLDKEEMIPLIKDVEGVIVGTDVVDDEVLAHGKCLKVVAKHGVGVDNIDLTARRRNIVVTNTLVPAALLWRNGLCMMLAISRNMVERRSQSAQRAVGYHHWLPAHRKKGRYCGLGAIGRCWPAC